MPRKKSESSTEGKVDGRVKPANGEESLGDDALKKRVVQAALGDAAFDGFTDAVLAKAGKSAGVEKPELERLFPEGVRSLIDEPTRLHLALQRTAVTLLGPTSNDDLVARLRGERQALCIVN